MSTGSIHHRNNAHADRAPVTKHPHLSQEQRDAFEQGALGSSSISQHPPQGTGSSPKSWFSKPWFKKKEEEWDDPVGYIPSGYEPVPWRQRLLKAVSFSQRSASQSGSEEQRVEQSVIDNSAQRSRFVMGDLGILTRCRATASWIKRSFTTLASGASSALASGLQVMGFRFGNSPEPVDDNQSEGEMGATFGNSLKSVDDGDQSEGEEIAKLNAIRKEHQDLVRQYETGKSARRTHTLPLDATSSKGNVEAYIRQMAQATSSELKVEEEDEFSYLTTAQEQGWKEYSKRPKEAEEAEHHHRPAPLILPKPTTDDSITPVGGRSIFNPLISNTNLHPPRALEQWIKDLAEKEVTTTKDASRVEEAGSSPIKGELTILERVTNSEDQADLLLSKQPDEEGHTGHTGHTEL